MNILLIGANSYVGARLFTDLRTSHTVTGTFANHPLSDTFIHLNITDNTEIDSVIAKTKPQVIIHAANNASASWCDTHPDEAKLLNETSTHLVARAAQKNGSMLVYISSMSVFDQSNVYGKTKLASEKIIQDTTSTYLILRPWLVLGYSPNTTNDRPFNRILKNIDVGTPAVYDTSWKFQPTYIRHISEVILKALEKNIVNDVIHIATPETCTRYQAAYDILTPFGIRVEKSDDRKTDTYTNPLSELKKYGLPVYSYTEMITNIISEIKNRNEFAI